MANTSPKPLPDLPLTLYAPKRVHDQVLDSSQAAQLRQFRQLQSHNQELQQLAAKQQMDLRRLEAEKESLRLHVNQQTNAFLCLTKTVTNAFKAYWSTHDKSYANIEQILEGTSEERRVQEGGWI